MHKPCKPTCVHLITSISWSSDVTMLITVTVMPLLAFILRQCIFQLYDKEFTHSTVHVACEHDYFD